MTNSLIYAEDGDDCKDGQGVDDKEKMIFLRKYIVRGGQNQ